MIADATAATVALLDADLSPTYIFGSEAPDDPDFNAAMPTECIVVQPAGGLGPADGSYLRLDGQRLEISYYGATPYQARRLAREGHEALKHVKRRVVTYTDDSTEIGVLIHSYTPSGGFVALREPETRWPRVLRAYVCTYSETEI